MEFRILANRDPRNPVEGALLNSIGNRTAFLPDKKDDSRIIDSHHTRPQGKDPSNMQCSVAFLLRT